MTFAFVRNTESFAIAIIFFFFLLYPISGRTDQSC